MQPPHWSDSDSSQGPPSLAHAPRGAHHHLAAAPPHVYHHGSPAAPLRSALRRSSVSSVPAVGGQQPPRGDGQTSPPLSSSRLLGGSGTAAAAGAPAASQAVAVGPAAAGAPPAHPHPRRASSTSSVVGAAAAGKAPAAPPDAAALPPLQPQQSHQPQRVSPGLRHAASVSSLVSDGSSAAATTGARGGDQQQQQLISALTALGFDVSSPAGMQRVSAILSELPRLPGADAAPPAPALLHGRLMALQQGGWPASTGGGGGDVAHSVLSTGTDPGPSASEALHRMPRRTQQPQQQQQQGASRASKAPSAELPGGLWFSPAASAPLPLHGAADAPPHGPPAAAADGQRGGRGATLAAQQQQQAAAAAAAALWAAANGRAAPPPAGAGEALTEPDGTLIPEVVMDETGQLVRVPRHSLASAVSQSMHGQPGGGGASVALGSMSPTTLGSLLMQQQGMLRGSVHAGGGGWATTPGSPGAGRSGGLGEEGSGAFAAGGAGLATAPSGQLRASAAVSQRPSHTGRASGAESVDVQQFHVLQQQQHPQQPQARHRISSSVRESAAGGASAGARGSVAGGAGASRAGPSWAAAAGGVALAAVGEGPERAARPGGSMLALFGSRYGPLEVALMLAGGMVLLLNTLVMLYALMAMQHLRGGAGKS